MMDSGIFSTSCSIILINSLFLQDVEKIPKIEFMLDVVYDHHSVNDPLWEDQLNYVMEPDENPEELVMKDKEVDILVMEDLMEHEEPPSVIST